MRYNIILYKICLRYLIVSILAYNKGNSWPRSFLCERQMPGGNNPILTNARPPGENVAANARPWGQVSVTNAPHCPGGGMVAAGID